MNKLVVVGADLPSCGKLPVDGEVSLELLPADGEGLGGGGGGAPMAAGADENLGGEVAVLGKKVFVPVVVEGEVVDAGQLHPLE